MDFYQKKQTSWHSPFWSIWWLFGHRVHTEFHKIWKSVCRFQYNHQEGWKKLTAQFNTSSPLGQMRFPQCSGITPRWTWSFNFHNWTVKTPPGVPFLSQGFSGFISSMSRHLRPTGGWSGYYSSAVAIVQRECLVWPEKQKCYVFLLAWCLCTTGWFHGVRRWRRFRSDPLLWIGPRYKTFS